LAAASAPDRLVPQIVLLSDGNETQGQVARAALGAGMPIDVVPLPSFSEPDACLIGLTPGPVDPVSWPDAFGSVVYSNHAGPARLQVTVDDQWWPTGPSICTRAKTASPSSIPARSGNPVVQVTVQAASDSIPENNVRRLRVRSPEPSHAADRRSVPQQAGFGTRWRATVHRRCARAGPARRRTADLAEYDLIVLANVSPLQIDARVDSTPWSNTCAKAVD
jgi:hypothetical protein